MAKRTYSKITPSIDTGWGLIFRLNRLWSEVENFAPKGKYAEWNFKLDRIWCNLVYRNNMDINKKGEKIVSIKLAKEDIEEKDYLDEQIAIARMEIIKIKKTDADAKEREIIKAKRKYYNAIMLKDIWLRKFMHIKLKLYLKEVEYDPAKAIYGGYG